MGYPFCELFMQLFNLFLFFKYCNCTVYYFLTTCILDFLQPPAAGSRIPYPLLLAYLLGGDWSRTWFFTMLLQIQLPVQSDAKIVANNKEDSSECESEDESSDIVSHRLPCSVCWYTSSLYMCQKGFQYSTVTLLLQRNL